MRPRMTTVLLAASGLLVAIAVGLVANAIASRSFTPGVDALPSAGSLAPPAVRTTAATAGTSKAGAVTTPKPATARPATKPKPKPKPAKATTTPARTATTPAPSTTPSAAPATVTSDDDG